MSDTLQSARQRASVHPDADQLAAFAEQVLPLDEQRATLAHLATCADCRQIVFLAQEAAGPAAQQAAPVAARKPWLSGWNVVWPVAAALAAMVALTVHLRQAAAPAAAPAAEITAKVGPPPPVLAPVPPGPATGEKEAKRSADVAVAKPAPALARTVTLADAGAAALPSVDGSLHLNGSLGQSLAGAATTQSAAAASPMQQQFRAADAPPAAQAQGYGQFESRARSQNQIMPQAPSQQQMQQAPQPAPPRAAAATVTVEAANEAGPTTMDAASLSEITAETRAAEAQIPFETLPSHLAVESSVARGSQAVALDSAGSVFFSKDEGKHWKQVEAAWPGRAVRVGPPGFAAAAKVPAAAGSAGLGLAARMALKPGLAEVDGSVTDASGASVPGATIRVQPEAGTDGVTARADSAGHFALTGLQPGSYRVEVSSRGFATQVHAITLHAGDRVTLSNRLAVAAATETVTVDGVESKRKAVAKGREPLFELTTDEGTVFTSADGQHWKRK